MIVETVSIDSLTLDPSNVRVHPEENLEAIKGSLARFGQVLPILVGPNNVIVGGNGTLRAALALAWTEIKIVRTDKTGADATALAIALNRSAELATWDDLGLCKLLDSIKRDDEQLFRATGFDDAGFDKLIRSLGDDAIQAGLATPIVEDEPHASVDPRWDVLIVCKTEQEQRELLERLAQEGRECRALIA